MIKISSLLSLSCFCAFAAIGDRASAIAVPQAALTPFPLTISQTESVKSHPDANSTNLDRATTRTKACSIRAKRCQLKSHPDKTSTDSREHSSPFNQIFDKLIGCNTAKSPTHCKGS